MRAISALIAAPLTGVIAVVTLAAYLIPALTEVIRIDLADPQRIQWYQIFGCHLLHWSAEHLFWDLAMFCILGGCCERWWPKQYYSAIGLSALLIPLVVILWQPEISSYRGLSGIDTALFSLMATRLGAESLRRSDWSQAVLFATLLASLAAKVAYEFMTGGLLFVSELNFVPLPVAHLVGGIVGAFTPLAGRRLRTCSEACNNGSSVRTGKSIPWISDPRCEQVSTKLSGLGRHVAAGTAGAGKQRRRCGTG